MFFTSKVPCYAEFIHFHYENKIQGKVCSSLPFSRKKNDLNLLIAENQTRLYGGCMRKERQKIKKNMSVLSLGNENIFLYFRIMLKTLQRNWRGRILLLWRIKLFSFIFLQIQQFNLFRKQSSGTRSQKKRNKSNLQLLILPASLRLNVNRRSIKFKCVR